MLKDLTFSIATPSEALAIAELRNRTADDLLLRFGEGHWRHHTNEKNVQLGMSAFSKTVLVRDQDRIVGTLRLATKKPWAIDVNYFTPVAKALYLIDMAVEPALQNKGVGRALLRHAFFVALTCPRRQSG